MILPLNENNRVVIAKALHDSAEVHIPCLCLSTHRNLTFKIEKLEGAYRFEIVDGVPNDRDIFFTGFTDIFIDIAIELLRKRCLRLFSPNEPHTILDWQFSPL